MNPTGEEQTRGGGGDAGALASLAAVESPDTPAARSHPAWGGAPARRMRFSRTMFRYIFRGLALNSLVAFLVLEAVQGIIFTVSATEDFSFDFLIIFPVLLRAFGQAVSYTVPIALLFGTGLLVGRLNADREMTALRGFGFSVPQLVAPVLALGVCVSAVVLVFNHQLVPRFRFVNRNVGALIVEQLGYLGDGWNLEYRSGARSLWIHHYSGPVLEGIFLSVSEAGEGAPVSQERLAKVQAASYPLYLFAEKGVVLRGTGELEGKAVVELRGVNIFFDNDFLTPDRPSDFMNRVHLERLRWTPRITWKRPSTKDLTYFELEEERTKRLETLQKATAENVGAKELRRAWDDHNEAIVEFHRRLALSLTVLTFPLSAFLVGIALRSMNRLLPFFLSSSLVPLVYFVSEMAGSRMADQGTLPLVTMELGHFALLALCAMILAWLRLTRR